MTFDRRRFLQAMGLGTVAGLRARPARGAGADASFPARIVFFIQPHAHVPVGWNMPIPGAPADRFAQRSLRDLAPEDFGEALRPLYPFRDRLLIMEGLAHTCVLMDVAEVHRTKGNDNNHQLAVADLLTGVRASQEAGVLGGARSIDQELAIRTAAPGRFGSRVYGFDYVPNLTVSPFSFLGPNQATPMVSDPAMAFADLMGYAPVAAGTRAREDLLRALRPSVLDGVAEEYDLLAARLRTEDRHKLEQHRDLVRELATNLRVGIGSLARCNPQFDGTGHKVTQFMRLIRLALACDLTRVVTFVAPVPQTPEFGYPAAANVHVSYAHASVAGHTSCGQTFSPTAERAMIDLGAWYARHFAFLLSELNSVPEGEGTLLDHTVVVWLTELGTPTHQHEDAFTLLAGGCNDFFASGRYVRYPRTMPNPIAGFPAVGPAHNRLFVSLLQAMGQHDTSFGMTSATGADGTTFPLTGPLSELHRT